VKEIDDGIGHLLKSRVLERIMASIFKLHSLDGHLCNTRQHKFTEMSGSPFVLSWLREEDGTDIKVFRFEGWFV
jgi:RecB family exonuclease